MYFVQPSFRVFSDCIAYLRDKKVVGDNCTFFVRRFTCAPVKSFAKPLVANNTFFDLKLKSFNTTSTSRSFIYKRSNFVC
jgi:hypothetical protein